MSSLKHRCAEGQFSAVYLESSMAKTCVEESPRRSLGGAFVLMWT